MKYPTGWQQNEQADPTGFMVQFFSPLESPTSPFRENVTFLIQPLLAPVALDDYLRFTLRQIPDPFKLEEPASATLADLSAYQVTYTGPVSPMQPLAGKFLMLCAVKETRAYTFCYKARTERFNQYLRLIQEMIESIDIR
jgi:hypothetical protein